jgi:hypothetical protein
MWHILYNNGAGEKMDGILNLQPSEDELMLRPFCLLFIWQKRNVYWLNYL